MRLLVVLLKLHMPSKVSKATKKTLESIKDDLSPSDMMDSILKDATDRRSS